jgi:hypothetical protein
MSAPINTGGPAFPHKTSLGYCHGMTLRDYFAAAALPHIDFGTRSDDEYFELRARDAYLIADAMLKAREAK